MNMFIIFATKSLNDGTKGFRFNVLGKKGLVRLRKHKSNGWNTRRDDCMTAIHMGKLTAYFEHKKPERKLHHFAG
jgi:hypothetical protein